jgi:S-adenosyl-L-methionine hydrolase (adenosine-forming)
MSRPIALLTDFGYDDAFAGIVKGVILTRFAEARIWDLTHGVPQQDVLSGALHLMAAAPFCPPDTVFMAVVDPGVGSERRGVIARSGSRLFVGPDNGLLWPAAAQFGEPEFFHLNRPRYWLPNPSATFHGRDVFAPIAAMLALGRAAEDFGDPIADAVRLELPVPVSSSGVITGEILMVDRFGNAVTNVRPEDLNNPPAESVTFQIEGHSVRGPSTHYGSVAPGDAVIVLGSMGFYEVSVNRSSAAECLGLRRGMRISARIQSDSW